MKTFTPRPLPLIDNCFFIDNSSMEYITTCPRSAYFHNIRRRRLAGAKPALDFGAGMHKVWDYRYSECPDFVLPQHTSEMHAILKHHFAEFPTPVEDHRTLDLAVAMIDMYNQIYATEPFTICQLNGVPAVELSFAYPLFTYEPTHPGVDPIQVFWTGRIDAIIKEGGQVLTMDHKTSSILGDGFFRAEGMSGQHRGYAWAYSQATGELPTGYLINAVRVPRPTQKDGFNLKPDGYQRAKYYLSKADVEEWRLETISHVSHFLDMHFAEYFPASRKWCVNKYGTCQYYDVCSLEQGSRETMLNSGIYEDNTWSPLQGEIKPKPLAVE